VQVGCFGDRERLKLRIRLRRLGKTRGFRRGERGQTLVEFVLVVPVLLLLLAGIFDFGRHFFTRLTLRHAVAEAARFAVTGNQLIDPGSGEPMTRAQSIIEVIVDKAGDLNVDLNGLQITPPDGGGPGDVVQISATYRDHFVMAPVMRFFSTGYVDFTVATVVRNEPVF
jgi:hypothetical protein